MKFYVKPKENIDTTDKGGHTPIAITKPYVVVH